MKKIIVAIICVAVLAFVAVAQANQVRFLSRTSTGVAPSQDVHYTVMDLNGNKIAENTVDAAEGEPVTINNLEPGTYFISAEQASTGYFGSITTEIFAQDAESGDGNGNSVDLVLGSDGLQVYNPNAPQTPVAPANNVATPTYGAPTSANVPGTIPGYYDGGYGYGGSGFGGGQFGWLGALGIGAGIAGLVVALTAISKDAD